MGFFEALFDFDGNGKVSLDDDLMFMWITHNVFSEEETGGKADDWSLDLAVTGETAEVQEKVRKAVAEAKEKAKKGVAQRELEHELSEIRRELYAVHLPYEIAQKDMAQEAVQAYRGLTARLYKVMPEDDGSQFYFECIELEHEIEGFIARAEKIYRIMSGDFHDDTDPVATKAAEVADLEDRLAKWELKEPDDCCSEAWDAWNEKREEYQEEIDERKSALDWDTLFESMMEECDAERYLNAYAESTKVLEKAQLCVGRLEQLAQVSKRIFQEVERLVDEQGTALSDVAWELEVAEPKVDSPKRKSWQKRLDALNQMIKRLDEIDYHQA